MSESIVLKKAYAFALRVVRLYKFLSEGKREFVLSKYVLNSGTLIGARIKSALAAEFRDGFTREMQVALQRAMETEYWLELLRDGGYLDDKEFESINADCSELIRLLTSIVKSSKPSV
jgi:four helix bundle protein